MIRNQIGNFYLRYGYRLDNITWIIVTKIQLKDNWYEIDTFIDVLGFKFNEKVSYFKL